MSFAPPFPDDYLPPKLRLIFEQRYYEQINRQATLEYLAHDPEFLSDPLGHQALLPDRGVVHARDIALQVCQVLETINGVLIPPRERPALFLKGYGVLLAYVHDIGLVRQTAQERTMHPEFAAQAMFDPSFDDLLDAIWHENCGNVAWRLLNLASQGLLEAPPQVVLRELLAMAAVHSKRKVPIAILNYRPALRQVLIEMIGLSLETLAARQQAGQTSQAELEQPRRAALDRFYQSIEAQAFAWLVSAHPAVQSLADDVIDTIRVLRCADALRQRGSVLKTSGNYEIFVDQQTAHAIYGLRRGSDQLFLLETALPQIAGEANLASCELGPDGHLRISFHRGIFASRAATQWAAYAAAVALSDIQADALDSFQRPPDAPGDWQPRVEPLALLERSDDNLEFVDMVVGQLRQISRSLSDRVRIVPSLQQASARERAIYLAAQPLDWDVAQRQALLAQVARSGHSTSQIDIDAGFEHVRLTSLRIGDILIDANTPSGFVYVPLGDGLQIVPLGNYQTFSVQAWMPIGITGVIRGALRNGMVVAEAPVELIIIPKDVYLRQWHFPYSARQLLRHLAPSAT